MAYYSSLPVRSRTSGGERQGGGLTRFSIRRFRYPEGFCPSLASRLALWTDWPEPGLVDIVWSDAVRARVFLSLNRPLFVNHILLAHSSALVSNDANTTSWQNIRYRKLFNYTLLCVFNALDFTHISLLHSMRNEIVPNWYQNCYKLW